MHVLFEIWDLLKTTLYLWNIIFYWQKYLLLKLGPHEIATVQLLLTYKKTISLWVFNVCQKYHKLGYNRSSVLRQHMDLAEKNRIEA